MRALVIRKYGNADVLAVENRPDPSPSPTEVLIHVAFSGINFSDIAARMGLYPDAPKPPLIAGYEVSGVVAALGTDVTHLCVGDRVLAFTHFGGQASSIVASADLVRKVPDGVSLEQAAALPVTYLTAYHMLFYIAPLRPNMRVFIHSAGGGVGLAAIDLCQTVDGVEIIGRASKVKHDFLRHKGVHHLVDAQAHDYTDEVRRLTNGNGVDRILDAQGGPDWARGYSMLRPCGHLLCFGWGNMVAGERRSIFHVASQFLQSPRFAPMDLMDKNRTVSGINMGRLWNERQLMSQHMDEILKLLEIGALQPHIDSIFSVEKAADAHRHIQARKNVGKVLLQF